MTATQRKETEIGIIPQEWEVLKLWDFANVVMGQSPEWEHYNNEWEWIPFMQWNRTFWDKYNRIDTRTRKTTKLWKKWSVLMSVRAPVWDINISVSDLCIWRWLCSIECKNWENNFLYYLLQANKDVIIWAESWTVFWSVNKNQLEWIQFPVPTLPEQQAIASILGSLDDKIELLREQNKTLEAIGQAIFKSWFVDFDGVTEFEDSELWPIPKGWKVGKLGEVIKLLWWFPFKTECYEDNWEYKLVTIGNVNDGYFDPICNNNVWILPEKLPDYCLLNPWDVLLSLTGNVGRVCMTFWNNYVLNQRVAKIVPNWWDHIGYCYFMMRQKSMQDLMFSISRGTAQMNLSPIETQNLEIIIPDKVILTKSETIFKEQYNKILKNNEQIQSLIQTRDSLLPRLMSGKVRVI